MKPVLKSKPGKAILPLALMAALSVSPAGALAQGLPSQEESLVIVSVIAERGEACGLLLDWQAAALEAQVVEAARDWDSATRARVVEARRTRLAETQCDNDLLNAWIEGARRNFESELLPPYLVVYRAMARMDAPPAAFSAVSLRIDYAPAIAAIDRQLERLEASGRPAEGGANWPDYVARTEAYAQEFAALLSGEGEEGRTSRDQAAGWIAQSALITEQWLAHTAQDGAQ